MGGGAAGAAAVTRCWKTHCKKPARIEVCGRPTKKKTEAAGPPGIDAASLEMRRRRRRRQRCCGMPSPACEIGGEPRSQQSQRRREGCQWTCEGRV